jgi:hypothetical protein
MPSDSILDSKETVVFQSLPGKFAFASGLQVYSIRAMHPIIKVLISFPLFTKIIEVS